MSGRFGGKLRSNAHSYRNHGGRRETGIPTVTGAAGTMAEGDTEAWGFLRAVRAYRAAFEDCAEAPAFEAAPFPVRIQAEADLAARDPWRILAWENPFAKGGPASPFWAEEPMLEGEGSPTAPPLVALLADAGARLDGLRLLDGTLIVKVEQDGRAVQIRVANDGPLLAGGASGSTTITGWSCRWISPGSRIYGASRAGRPLGKGGVGGRGTGTSIVSRRVVYYLETWVEGCGGFSIGCSFSYSV